MASRPVVTHSPIIPISLRMLSVCSHMSRSSSTMRVCMSLRFSMIGVCRLILLSTVSGISMVNSLPMSTILLTPILPPISPARFFVIASPSPVPPNTVVVEVSTCSKASNMNCMFSSGIPQPVSLTTKRSFVISFSIEITLISRLILPLSVNLTAFPSTFTSIC